MGLSAVTYALCKKYVNDSLIGIGALKGAPCKIKSIIKKDGQNIITFEWLDDLGNTHESQLFVDDGTPIYTWSAGDTYNYGDLVIYESCFYRCVTPNSDPVFNPTHWNAIGSPDGSYDIVETEADLPPRFTSADRRMYYVIEEQIFYLWDGTEWVPQNPNTISNDEIDDLFGF